MQMVRMRRLVSLAVVATVAVLGGLSSAQPASAATAHCGGFTNYQKKVSATWGEIHVPTTSTSSANTGCVLYPGDKGNGVKALQAALIYCFGQYSTMGGYSGIDGDYGSRTKQAVVNAQKSLNESGAGLSTDGQWGSNTRKAFEYPLYHYSSNTVYDILACTKL
jgi:peptidoglycan hydrolase-like protein with peptidoglycan-binding domain